MKNRLSSWTLFLYKLQKNQQASIINHNQQMSGNKTEQN